MRILVQGTDGPAGLGFVVDAKHIVTCAHVVNAALGREARTSTAPGESARVHVDFPLLGGADGPPARSCRVAVWDPPLSSDVAGLAIVGGEELPAGAGPARLGNPSGQVSVFDGRWRPCAPHETGDGGLLELDITVEPGAAGTPVVSADEFGDAVIGMYADGYVVPLSHLVPVWPKVLDPRLPAQCPYRGLRAFTGADADSGLFVGREGEVEKLRQMTRRQPVVVVVGASGVGKSSLVGAGVLPALRRDGWAVSAVRPGASPFDALARTLLDLERPHGAYSLADLDNLSGRLRRDGVWRVASQLSVFLKRPLALVVDQLEEAFTLHNEEFLDKLIPDAASGENDDVRLICTLRVDFLPALIELPGFGSRLQDRQLNLSPLDAAAMVRVITEPAALGGVRYADGLPQTLAADASRGRGGLPLLEFTLTELWKFQENRLINFDHYHSVGGVSGTLNRHAEKVYREITETVDPARVRRVLLAMVRTREGAGQAVKVTVRKEHLGADWQVAEMLALPGNRLVVLGTDGPETAEIAHEALVRAWDRFGRWVDEDAAFQHWLALMEERATEEDELSEARLVEAHRWLEERADDVPEAVVALVVRSRSVVQRRVDALKNAERVLAEERARARAQIAELEKARQRLEEKAWQLSRASAYKTEFMANMSHELRTPLNSLLVLARLLAEGDLTAKQADFARTIYSAGTDLVALIDDILDLASIEAGRVEIEPGEVRLGELCAYLEQVFAPQAGEKGLLLRAELEPGLPDVIVTDAQRLRQILANLLSNAVKFTDTGSVALRIFTAPASPDLPTLATAQRVIGFAVTDTGIGIDEARLATIFEPFQQAGGVVTRRSSGAGLGLSIGRDVAAMLGGTIVASSRPGSGSVFTLYLPDPFTGPAEARPSLLLNSAVAEALSVGDLIEPAARPASRRLDGATVLLVDDDVRSVFALTSALETRGLNVLYADTAHDGLRLLAEHPEVGIVLVDAMMPANAGLALVDEIRRDERRRGLPVLLLTSGRAPRNAANETIAKPVDLDELINRMARWIHVESSEQ
ncbi:nSTAND1 domain-containing NTPase, partial [Paractinoplanes deccanensis]|uniref:nSTAND1 domain-containing NTPase n=1 Tax=Paractinoplanes deccanensis TaxID=113561 RepID=UPI00194420E7